MSDQAPPEGNDQNTDQARSRPKPPALPLTKKAMLEQRKRPIISSINDEMDTVHLSLMDEGDANDKTSLAAKYIKLLDAVYNSQAVEGSLTGDDYAAAWMIREYARDNKYPLLMEAKLDTIVHALRVVMNRYNIGRKYRRHMVSGEYVRDDDDNSH